MDAASELLKLAEDKFGKLTAAEKKLFRAAAEGEIADYSPRGNRPIDPANAAKWGPSRVLLAHRITWLCTDREASQLVTHRGIHINAARIDEKLDLLHAKVRFPLAFERSSFSMEICLQHAEIPTLNLGGTYVEAIRADGLNLRGDLFLRHGFKAKGEVCLLGATIGGGLFCRDGEFTNTGGFALEAECLKVKGNVILDQGFRASGEVCLFGAILSGNLDCEGGLFLTREGNAINADGIKVGGSVFLRNGFTAEGGVRLLGATIRGSLDCREGHFVSKGGEAFVGDGLDVKGSVFLNKGFSAEGEVRLLCATIGVNLDCIKGEFINGGEKALIADRLDVKGSVFLCDKDLDESSKDDGFRVEGQVCLRGAKIGGDLDCRRGTFVNRGKVGLFANGIRIQGDVFLCDELKAECKISLLSARIGGLLHYHGLDSARHIWLDLRYANIRTLRDEEKSWPENGRLFLHGLLYDEIHNNAPRNANSRVDWIRRQSDMQRQGDLRREDNFWTQPYEQLAKVLRQSGDDAGARNVLIAKNKDKAQLTHMTWCQRGRHWLFGATVGYGHKPWRSMWWALGFILAGWLLLWVGHSCGLVTPLSESAYAEDNTGARHISETYPVFNSLVYSIDVFVPVVDLHQAKYWLPNANCGSELVAVSSLSLCWGGLLLGWLWFETACGWVLTTLLLVGITGLVRT